MTHTEMIRKATAKLQISQEDMSDFLGYSRSPLFCLHGNVSKRAAKIISENLNISLEVFNSDQLYDWIINRYCWKQIEHYKLLLNII